MAKNNDSSTVGNNTAAHLDSILMRRTICNINNWSYWIYSDGKSGIDPKGNAGGIFPINTANCIYQDGLLWGGLVDGKVFVGGQRYKVGTRPLSDNIYRIRYDWPILTRKDVVQDAAELFLVAPDSVTYEMEDAVLDKYRKDWKNWPVDKGAPYVDVDGDGTYNPVLSYNGLPNASRGDYPGIRGADQVIWFSVDDQDSKRMDAFYSAKSVGIREDVTLWAYKQAGGPLNASVFKKYKITNISMGKVFTKMYLGQWIDPDLGDFQDDLIGCDSVANSGFVYNYGGKDRKFDNLGIGTPVAGCVLLQGPIVASASDTAIVDFNIKPGFRNLPMTNFVGDDIPEILPWPGSDEVKYSEFYKQMRGYLPESDADNPTPFIHKAGPYKGRVTKFPLNGDLLSGEGDLDGQGDNLAAADRKMILSSGPFDLHPGESQEMMVAFVGGMGDSLKAAYKNFKNNVALLHLEFNSLNKWDDNLLGLIYTKWARDLPNHTVLEQNYPNPFNPITKIHYRLYETHRVKITVYNLNGQVVRVLQDGMQTSGNYTVTFDGGGLASGVYIYTLKLDDRSLSNKMLLLK